MLPLELPKNIDYSKYESTSGMSTKHWGPSYWTFLFTAVMGTYPVKVDWDNKNDIELVSEFTSTIKSLVSILPCIFCRESLNGFFFELPIEPYTGSRVEMMYWVYLIKDKVNSKLIKQEKIILVKQAMEIKQKYP